MQQKLELVYRKINKNLLAARHEQGLTQEELAKRAKTSRLIVANYETNRSRLALHELLRVCKVLGLTLRKVLK